MAGRKEHLVRWDDCMHVEFDIPKKCFLKCLTLVPSSLPPSLPPSLLTSCAYTIFPPHTSSATPFSFCPSTRKCSEDNIMVARGSRYPAS